MARPNQDKVRINISIDKELNDILHRKGENKSALISSLLWKFLALERNKKNSSLLSQDTNHLTMREMGFEPMNLTDSILRDKGLERRDKESRDYGKILYFIHTKHREEWELYLYEQFSQNYSRDMFNTLDKVFNREKARSIDDIKEIINKKVINDRAVRTSYRVFLNFIESKELLEENDLFILRKKIKLNISTSVDSFVPTKKEIDYSLDRLNQIDPKFEIFYRLILESGCRPSELKEFLVNFDENKIEEWDEEIIVYRNFYLRNSKNSFYLFFTKETFERFLSVDRAHFSKDYESFRERIKRFKEIINLKYLRKYHFSLMIEKEVTFEIANFIQGRTSNNIGFNHYLAKKTIAVREYKKIIKEFQYMIS